jgi:alanine racemase
MRATCLVNLGAIQHNVSLLVRRVTPAAVCAVVKADGYGHGALPTARAALAGGAGWLGVVSVDEALALRAGGIEAPVLVFLVPPSANLVAAIVEGIDLGVGGPATLDAVVRAAQIAERPGRVHLEIDTGLGRGGSTPAAWTDLVTMAALAAARGIIEIIGIWSHFACADDPGDPATAAQLATFRNALKVATRTGVQPPLRHIANSAALFAEPSSHLDLVRPGIAIYGLSPGPAIGTARELGLRPAMTLLAEVALTKRVPAAYGVSYGHRYRTSTETTLAVVSIGYGDGIPRSAGGVAEVLIHGRRRRIAGTLCMDQLVVDVGDDPVVVGDEVVVFGPGDQGEPTADDWARSLGTIPNEIVTRIGSRVPRRYFGEMQAGLVGG